MCDTLCSHANRESKVFYGLRYYCLCLHFHIWGKLRLQVEFIKFWFQHSVLPLGTEFLWNETLGSVPEQEQNISRFLLAGEGGSKIVFLIEEGCITFLYKISCLYCKQKNRPCIYHCRHTLGLYLMYLFMETERIALLHLLAFCLVIEDAEIREYLRSCLEEDEKNRWLGFLTLWGIRVGRRYEGQGSRRRKWNIVT